MSNKEKPSNHLIDEKSPYLLQHAYNPVNWYPWGDLAFKKARDEDKPILLSVGYSTCHWCHVMAHESFEDNGIADLINASFVAIKVDREERPDIDHIYMTATTAMTGQGGWPLTVFLTPQAEPFYGGTYFPPYAKWGSVGFADLLSSIARAWQGDRDDILSSSRSLTENLQKAQLGDKQHQTGDRLGEDVLHHAFRQLRGQYDPAYGGFGTAPKFPMGHNLSFLLRYNKRNKDTEALAILEKTLSSMAQGGILDHLGGGFHRYSTDQSWHVPHFEKMLYDQALLTRAYLEAYQATGVSAYALIARQTLDYVLREMTDPMGGFYSAQDADSTDHVSGHLTEGAFYVFSSLEIEEALGQEKAAVFNYCYGVLPEGNATVDPHGEFKGKNILFRAHTIKDASLQFHRPEDEIEGMLNACKAQLLALRGTRPHPHLDDKVLCDWNGLMIGCFAFAGRVLDDTAYTKAACRSADFILAHMMTNGRLLHRWREGLAGIPATLEDHAFFVDGLIDVYEATFEDKYLEAAKDLAGMMIKYFADPLGGFYMTASDAERLIMRPKEAYDGALPSGNSAAALVLQRLYALTHQEDYFSQAQKLFSFFSASIAQAPYAHCFLLSALDWHLTGALELSFQGKPKDAVIAKMTKVLYKQFVPFKAVSFKLNPLTTEVSICTRGVCHEPMVDIEAFELFLRRS